MKYYSTVTNGFYIPDKVCGMVNLYSGKRQYRLVIKAKSMAAANRRWKELTGDSGGVFRSDFTSETGNEEQLRLCDIYGEILGDLHNGNYVSLAELIEIKNNNNN